LGPAGQRGGVCLRGEWTAEGKSGRTAERKRVDTPILGPGGEKANSIKGAQEDYPVGGKSSGEKRAKKNPKRI